VCALVCGDTDRSIGAATEISTVERFNESRVSHFMSPELHGARLLSPRSLRQNSRELLCTKPTVDFARTINRPGVPVE
jgi:hypothetical protein